MEKYIGAFLESLFQKREPVRQTIDLNERTTRKRKKNCTILSVWYFDQPTFHLCTVYSVYRKIADRVYDIFSTFGENGHRAGSYSRETKRRPCFIRMYLELTSGTFEQWEPRAIQTIRHLYPAAASLYGTRNQ